MMHGADSGQGGGGVLCWGAPLPFWNKFNIFLNVKLHFLRLGSTTGHHKNTGYVRYFKRIKTGTLRQYVDGQQINKLEKMLQVSSWQSHQLFSRYNWKRIQTNNIRQVLSFAVVSVYKMQYIIP